MWKYLLPSYFIAKKMFKLNLYKFNIKNNYVLNSKFNSSFGSRYSNKSFTKTDKYKKKNFNLIRNKYKIFSDKDVPVIFDINEEKEKIELTNLNLDESNSYEISLHRGIYGVFDIEDLVNLLRRDKNCLQIFVTMVPKIFNYVDYIVIVTGKSPKHMNAVAIYVRKIYKAKRHKYDLIPVIEGKDTNDWIALDLGNIALHIFSQESRLKYDLETLWSVGSQYDDLSKEQIKNDLMEKYKDFLKILQPAE